MRITAAILLLLLPGIANAQEVAALAAAIYESPGNLVIAVGLVAGFATVISGITHFKNNALSKMQYPASEGYAKVLTGCAMLGFTFIYTAIKNSFFTAGDDSWNTTANPIAISKSVQDSNDAAVNSFIDVFTTTEFKAMVFGMLWIIGLIFVFVGLYKFKDVGSKKEGSIKGPIIQVIGGVACMNPMIALCIIAALGPGFLCPEGT